MSRSEISPLRSSRLLDSDDRTASAKELPFSNEVRIDIEGDVGNPVVARPSPSEDTVFTLPPYEEDDRYVGDDDDDAISVMNSYEDLWRRKLDAMPKSQRRAYEFFERPRGFWPRAFQSITYLLLFAFTILFLVESLPQFLDSHGNATFVKAIFPFETIIVVWWTIELVGRFYGSPIKKRFLFMPSTIIDLITIFPYFLFFIDNPRAQVARKVLLSFRLLKFVQIMKHSVGVKIAIRALTRSTDAIITLMAFLVTACLLTSTAMHYAERGIWNDVAREWQIGGERSKFQSIPEGFYWGIVTLATVGYGDVTPITPIGKLIASITMIFSIMTIALPTSIIGSNFMAEYQLHQRKVLQKKMKKYAVANENEDSSFRMSDEQNRLVMQSVAEIQEKLNDINPPRYYQKFKEGEMKLANQRKYINNLETKVRQLRQRIKQMKSMDKVGRSQSKEEPEDIDTQTDISKHTSTSAMHAVIGAKSWIISKRNAMHARAKGDSIGTVSNRPRSKTNNSTKSPDLYLTPSMDSSPIKAE